MRNRRLASAAAYLLIVGLSCRGPAEGTGPTSIRSPHIQPAIRVARITLSAVRNGTSLSSSFDVTVFG